MERGAITEIKAYSTSSKKKGKVFVPQRDFYSLTYRYSGKIMVEANGKTLYSDGGSVMFVPKGVSYNTEIIENMRMAVIHFKLDRDIDFRNPAVLKIHDNGIKQLFESILRNYHVGVSVDYRCMSLLYELFARLEEHRNGDNVNKTYDRMRAVKEYIEQRYSDPSVYVESIASEFGISTSYLRREFSKVYGISPVIFLRDVRVNNSKNMLESGYLSVEEIAEQCGFSSASYFIQVFHKTVGETPAGYRKCVTGR